MVLTRDAIKSGLVRQMAAELGVAMRMLTEEELLASRQVALAGVDVSAGAHGSTGAK